MRIYKSNLNQLLNEAQSPFWIMNLRKRSDSKDGHIIYCAQVVTVTGLNEYDQVCELYLSTPNAWTEDLPACEANKKQADAWEDEIRARLKLLEIEVRDGRWSDEPLLGVIE